MAVNNLRGAGLALAAFAVYSSHDVVVKIMGGVYAPFQVIFFSVLFSFPLVTFLLIRDQSDGNLIPRHPWWCALRTVSVVVTAICSFYAFSVLPMAQTYAIFFATPLIITLMSIPMLGEQVGLRRGIAVFVGLVGVMVVVRPGAEPLAWGHLSALVAAVGGSFSSVIVRKVGNNERSVVLLIYPMMANIVILGAILPFVYVPMPIGHIGLIAAIALLSMTGMILTISAYRNAEAAIVAPMQYSQIIWAVIFGALLFNETPDFWTAVGAAIIIASGIYIVMREAVRSRSSNQPVLATQARPEVGVTPRVSSFLRIFGRADPRRATGRASV